MTNHISMKSGLFLAIILVALTGFDKGFEIIKERGATYQQVTRPQIKGWVEVGLDSHILPLDVYYPGAQTIWLYQFKHNPGIHALVIAYAQEQQGEELINSENRIFESRLDDPKLKGDTYLLGRQKKRVPFNVMDISFPGKELSVLSHYQVLEITTTSASKAKLLSIGKLFYPNSKSVEFIFLLDGIDFRAKSIKSVLEGFYVQMSSLE